MNFFKKKRKVDEEHKEHTKEIQPASKKSRLVSIVKSVGENIRSKVTVALNALTGRSYTHRIPSALFTTPAGPLRSARYVMTPLDHFSVKKAALKWRKNPYYLYDSVIPVTESKQHEFKTGGGKYPINILPKHVQKYGCAFLNSDGGVLMAGILDNGRVCGISCPERRRREVVNIIDKEFSYFLPKVPSNFYRIEFVPVYERSKVVQLKDLFVLELTVSAGHEDEIYETGEHKVFIRREGSIQGPLNPLQIKDIVLSKYKKKLERRRIEKLQEVNETETDVDTEKKKNTDKVTSPKRSLNKEVIIVSP